MRGSAAPIEDLRATLAHIPIKEEDGEVVLSPSSTEEVADVLRYCNERALPLEITGGRTKRTWAGAAEARLILDTTRLNGVREHPWQDLTATVGAGTTWFEMQRVLAAHNQFVALDPLWPEHATVGGVLATNDSGALRVKYGSARDLVIGMTLVLADGTIAKTGGKVVKNVAGYDLHKLMIGAFGTLAVTTEVTFRLHPLRSSRATWRMVAASVEPVGKLVAAITTSNLNPEALQVRTVPGGFALDVLLSSAPEVLRSKGEALGAIAASNHTTALVLEEGADPFRQRELLLGSAPGTHVKITAHPTDIPAILSEITHAGGEAVAYPYGVVHAGIGSRDRIPQSLGPLVKPSGGGVSVLGESAEATQLMREIKLKFDPERILNRGFMGGI